MLRCNRAFLFRHGRRQLVTAMFSMCAPSNAQEFLGWRKSHNKSSSYGIRVKFNNCLQAAAWAVPARGFFVRASKADQQKEDALKYRRVVFDKDNWILHRSSRRHVNHFLSIASSRVILSLGPAIFSLTMVATAVAAYNEAVICGLLPFFFPLLHISPMPFQLTAPALGLLLVFRTNSSYGRYDEGRKAFGSNINRTRDLTRQALCFIKHPEDAAKQRALLSYIVALSFCLKEHVVAENLLKGELKDVLLSEEELKAVLASAHRPNLVLQLMSEMINSCKHLGGVERCLMDNNITQLHDNLGACERIFRTPIPLSYTHLTSRMLILWHITLPLALWDSCHWLMVPATTLSATTLFCIDEVGVIIEEPFSILPLESICATIQKNVKDLIQAHQDISTQLK